MRITKQEYRDILLENERLRCALHRLQILNKYEITFNPKYSVYPIEALVNFLNDDPRLFDFITEVREPQSKDIINELSISPEMFIHLTIEAILDEIATIVEGKDDTDKINFQQWLKTVAQRSGFDSDMSFSGMPEISTVKEVKEAVLKAREKLARRTDNEA